MMKGKRNEGKKRKKKRKKRKRGKKPIRGRIITKSDTEGVKKDIFPPNLDSTYFWGKISFWGGGDMILEEINTPGQRLMNISPTKSEFLFTPSLPLAASAPAPGFFSSGSGSKQPKTPGSGSPALHH